MSERVEAIERLARERGWSGASLRLAADVVGALMAWPVADRAAMSWFDGRAPFEEELDELLPLGELEAGDAARAAEVRRRRLRGGGALRDLVADLCAAAAGLDQAASRDLAGEVRRWLVENGPAGAETTARGIRARTAAVRQVLATDPRFAEAEKPAGAAHNARWFGVRADASEGEGRAGTGDSGDSAGGDGGASPEGVPVGSVPDPGAPLADALAGEPDLAALLAPEPRPWAYPTFLDDFRRWLDGEGDEPWRAEVEATWLALQRHGAAVYAAGGGSPEARQRYEGGQRELRRLLDEIAGERARQDVRRPGHNVQAQHQALRPRESGHYPLVVGARSIRRDSVGAVAFRGALAMTAALFSLGACSNSRSEYEPETATADPTIERLLVRLERAMNARDTHGVCALYADPAERCVAIWQERLRTRSVPVQLSLEKITGGCAGDARVAYLEKTSDRQRRRTLTVITLTEGSDDYAVIDIAVGQRLSSLVLPRPRGSLPQLT